MDQVNALMIAGAIGSSWALAWGLVALVDFFVKIAGR